MELVEIRRQLQTFTGRFPRQALQAAIARKEEVTPWLLQVVREARQHATTLVDHPDAMAHLYAPYLLAQFRETQAYPLLVELFSLPGELTLDLMGDFVTEDLGRVLASVCGNDTRLITHLVELPTANVYVRNAALEALLCLVACGAQPRASVVAYYRGLFQGGFPRTPSYLWDSLVCCCTALYPEELYPEIQHAYREGLVDEQCVTQTEVAEELAFGKERVLAKLQDRHYQLIDNTIAEIEWWVCFHPTRPRKQIRPTSARHVRQLAQQPLLATPKIGRNELCPCGSGKKYKKCCGR